MICKKIISLLIALVSLVFSEAPVFEPMDNIDVAPMNITIYQSMNITVYSMYGDYDGDGLSNTDEKRIGSDPANYDTDGDEIWDGRDAFPLDANESVDTDGDGVGNNADTDDDNDSVLDIVDAFPLDATESVDTDGDGVGNNADTDDDGDGVLDSDDAFPLDSSEWLDTDGDGIGNNADTDDDGDGVSDGDDFYPLDVNRSECSTLQIDVEANGNLPIDTYEYYKLLASPGDKVKITMNNLTADVDMYIGLGTVPTNDYNSCYSINGDTEDEECIVDIDNNTTVFIKIRAFDTASSYTLLAQQITEENQNGGDDNNGGSGGGGSDGGNSDPGDDGSSSGGSGGGCTYNPNAKGFDAGLMLMLLLSVVYPFRRKLYR